MIEKAVPPDNADGWAFTVLFEVSITISVGLKLPMDSPLTIALLKFTVPKSARGSTPPELDGASAITSAEESFAPVNVCVVENVHFWVLSEMTNLKEVLVTSVALAEKMSPALTGLLMVSIGSLG